MRRPRKPFVTEYKTSGRRSPAGFDMGFDNERPVGKSALDLSDRGDEPMDAAMRAADALFSRLASPEPADTSPQDAASEHANDAAGNGGKASGRILRALDEEPEPAVAALETERTPKKRGRKPGSKNKPKERPVDLFDTDGDDDVVWPVPQAALPVSAVPPVLLANLKAAAARANGIPAPAPRRPANMLWKGDRLKRWEGWKRRRLPRVCW